MSKDKLDAERFRFLMKNYLFLKGGSTCGPDHPVLEIHADIFAEHPEISVEDRILAKIDEEMRQ